MPSGGLAIGSILQSFGQFIAIVAAVQQQSLDALGKPRNLGQKALVFAFIGRIDTAQKRKNKALFGGGYHHLVAVTPHPAIMLAVAPGRLQVSGRRGFLAVRMRSSSPNLSRY